jgi:hypothetical protein
MRLRAAGVDVITAQEDGHAEAEDERILDRATGLRRGLFTQDQDFLAEAARRQRAGVAFAPIFFARQRPATLRACAEWLQAYAELAEWDEACNQVMFIS